MCVYVCAVCVRVYYLFVCILCVCVYLMSNKYDIHKQILMSKVLRISALRVFLQYVTSQDIMISSGWM